MPLYSSFIFSLNKPCLNDQLSCCYCEGVVKKSKRSLGGRSGAQPFKVRITPFRISKGMMALLSPIYISLIPLFMTDANESF